jgi:hypothetical protein
MWVAVPILLVVVIAGLWWAIFSNPKTPNTPTPTPTVNLVEPQYTAQPTAFNTLPLLTNTPTRPVLIEQTATPGQDVATPAAGATVAPAGLAIGDTAKVTGTGGQGVNMRSGAGTSNARVKTLADGSTVEIIGGPTEANDFTWWQVRDSAGVSGWVVSRYLDKQ